MVNIIKKTGGDGRKWQEQSTDNIADRRFVVTATYSYALTFNDTLVQLTVQNRFAPGTPKARMLLTFATKW